MKRPTTKYYTIGASFKNKEDEKQFDESLIELLEIFKNGEISYLKLLPLKQEWFTSLTLQGKGGS